MSKKSKKYGSKTKMAYGGTPVKIQNPYEAILKSQQNVIRAEQDAENRSQGWKMAGDILTQLGSMAMSSSGASNANFANQTAQLSGGLSRNDMSYNEYLSGMMGIGANYGMSKMGKGISKFDKGGIVNTPISKQKKLYGNKGIDPTNPPQNNYKAGSKTDVKEQYDPVNNKWYRTYTQWEDFKSGDVHPLLGQQVYLEDLDEDTRSYYATVGKPMKEFIDAPTINNTNTLTAKYDQGRKVWYGDYLPGYKNTLNPSDFNNRLVELKKNNPHLEFDTNYMYEKVHSKPGTRKTYGLGGNIPIEAEGQELIETPDGELSEIQGASHEQGGVDMEVPQGSVIYSKRLKGADGKSMAQRKEFREKHLAKLQKLVELNTNDKVLKNTYEKTLKSFEKQEQEDIEYMNYMNDLSNNKPIMKAGGVPEIPKLATPGIVPQNNDFNLGEAVDEGLENRYHSDLNGKTFNRPFWSKVKNYSNKVVDVMGGINDSNPYTIGDITSMYGAYKQANDPLSITREQRFTDTPNINSYRNYGQKGLHRLEETKDYITSLHNRNLRDLTTERDTSLMRNRLNSRSINTSRVFDMATDVQNQKGIENAYMQYLGQINNIMLKEADMLNNIDDKVMSGDSLRDENDRKDRDAYYKQLSRDYRNRGRMIQELGKLNNKVKERQTNLNSINNLGHDFEVLPDGTLRLKNKNGKINESDNPNLKKKDTQTKKYGGKVKK